MGLTQPAAYNSSGVPAFDAQFWYSFPAGLDGPDDLGMIMPGPVGLNGRQMPTTMPFRYAILTFRDAGGARWIRMPDGTLRPQDHATAHDSIFAALGRPLPAPAEPAGQPAEPAPGRKQERPKEEDRRGERGTPRPRGRRSTPADGRALMPMRW